MNRVSWVLLIALLTTSCASTSEQSRLGYTLTQDKFKGYQRYSIVAPGSLDGGEFLALNDVFIDIFTDVKNEKVGTSLAVILHFEHWVFIASGESLILMVDGKKMAFSSPTGSALNRGVLGGLIGALGGVRVREEADYAITTEQIKKLAYAKNVKVRIYGSKGTVTRTFNKDYLNSIKNYYEKFIVKNEVKSL